MKAEEAGHPCQRTFRKRDDALPGQRCFEHLARIFNAALHVRSARAKIRTWRNGQQARWPNPDNMPA